MDTDWIVLIFAQFGHKSVVIRMAVVPRKGSQTPLLLSKEFLKQLGTNMDLSKGEVGFSNLGIRIRMGITSRGYFVIPIIGNHDAEIMNDDVDMIYTKHICTYEMLHTEEQRAKRAVTSQEAPDKCAALSAHGPYTCYVEEQDDEQPSSLDLCKVIQIKKTQEEEEKKKPMEQMLDQAPDLPSDEQGNTELMKDYSLLTGKYKDKMFSETYVEKKDYVDWIRKNVVSDNSKFSFNMLEFCLYIETRDQLKILRLKREKAEKEAIYISTPIPRKAAQRRSNVECIGR